MTAAKTSSDGYFAEVAQKWDEIRSGYFTEGMRDAAIAQANLPSDAVVADIGTGTGFVTEGLAPKVRQVYGFDSSVEMIAVAQKNLASFNNVTLQVTDGQYIPLPDESLNGVFANMYLHHTPDPAAAIQEMTRLLKSGGVLCITDLDMHTNTWFREEMADVWLGFERTDVRKWYGDAGLTQIMLDCAQGTCDCTGSGGEAIKVTVFIALERK